MDNNIPEENTNLENTSLENNNLKDVKEQNILKNFRWDYFKIVSLIVAIFSLFVATLTLCFNEYHKIMTIFNEPKNELMSLKFENEKLKFSIDNLNSRFDSTIASINSLYLKFHDSNELDSLNQRSFEEGEFITLSENENVKVKILQILPYEDWIKFEIYTPEEKDEKNVHIKGRNNTYEFKTFMYRYVIKFWSAMQDNNGKRKAILSINHYSL